MLEFNQTHKGADMSSIKPKLEKVKQLGKVVLGGITVSSVILLSGCEARNKAPQTAIITENGSNAIVVDVEESLCKNSLTWQLTTMSGDIIYVSTEDVKLINGEDSHAKAEEMAKLLVGENGTVTCYDEVSTFNKSK